MLWINFRVYGATCTISKNAVLTRMTTSYDYPFHITSYCKGNDILMISKHTGLNSMYALNICGNAMILKHCAFYSLSCNWFILRHCCLCMSCSPNECKVLYLDLVLK